jgi:hypothetical protein
MRKILIFLLALTILRPALLSANHNLSQIERRCEVYKYSDSYGELDCRSGVTDRRALERKCEVYFSGDYGHFECRGSHYKDVERKCEAELYTSDYAEIDC